MAAQGEHEQAADLKRDHGREQSGEDSPDDQGVPLPLPEQMDELHGVAVAEVQDVGFGHGQAVGAEEDDAGMDEGKEEQPLQRSYHVDADLGGDVVEVEEPGEQEHGDRGGAEEGVDAEHDGDGKAPGEPLGADASFEHAQERAQDAAA